MPGSTRKRGRPREFDPAVALRKAEEAFLRDGYAGTSLDALADAMDVNKPSLYAAFGDKRALYMAVLRERYRRVGARYATAFARGGTLEEALRYFFEEAVNVTLGEGGPPGCPIASAAATESLVDEEVGEFARQFRAQTDKAVARWIREKLGSDGEVSADGIARLANGIVHDIALRARVGEPRGKLRDIARDAAKALVRAATAKG